MRFEIFIDEKKLPSTSGTDNRWTRLKDDLVWMTHDPTVMSCAVGDGSYRIIRRPDLPEDEQKAWEVLSKDLME